ncbi:hypothetical protein FGO68_gene6673 [Halteria grandinella]|uniref:TLDc domain-containing protein n=1 Tax=Halteria grandinella TaxID=5974 RepID=A0A8J8NT57_HALGN|nr:hypothetical protein FGO68_gene6673 [Halteria grandinella]
MLNYPIMKQRVREITEDQWYGERIAEYISDQYKNIQEKKLPITIFSVAGAGEAPKQPLTHQFLQISRVTLVDSHKQVIQSNSKHKKSPPQKQILTPQKQKSSQMQPIVKQQTLFEDSFILVDSSKKQTMINYIAQMGKTNIKLALLYRATRDGFGNNDFHRTCDKKGPILVIILTTDGCVLGGFTSDEWESNFQCKPSYDGWLFTIAHPHPFKRTIGNDGGILCGGGFGIWFGYKDIGISENSNMNSDSFVHGGGNSYEFGGVSLLNVEGVTNFRTKEIEIYKVA